VRLDLAGSNFPQFDINPNSGEPEGSAAHPRAARNRIFVDRSRPSHLVLPVIPPGGTKAQRVGWVERQRSPPVCTVLRCRWVSLRFNPAYELPPRAGRGTG